MARQKEVPVVTYKASSVSGTQNSSPELLGVDQSEAPLPRATDGHAGRKAVACNKSVFSKLTPTLRTFTLEGKVAVITG